LLEQGVVRMAEYLNGVSGFTRLCLGGGCALNCSMNGALLRTDVVDELYVNPAPHDMSSAVGAALWLHREITGERPSTQTRHSFLGPKYSDQDVLAVLEETGVTTFKLCDDIAGEAAQRIAAGEMIGWFQGRMELGPRALGGRSILADPRDPDTLTRVNALKSREQWRPLAPSILAEDAATFLRDPAPSPFMHIAFEATDEARESIPAAIHVDGSLRAQVIEEGIHPRFEALIRAFRDITGHGAVLNTSFNLSRQPLVMTPRHALSTFFTSALDCLAIENYLVSKEPRK
jgi:carbamoyltransferase